MYYNSKPIEDKNGFPKVEHFAVLTFESRCIHHEGDERSRTCPGHGYPEYTETVRTVKYHSFSTEGEMVKYIQHLESQRDKVPYQAIRVRPLQVQTEIAVSFK